MIELNNFKILTTFEDIRQEISINPEIKEIINPEDPDTGKHELYSAVKSYPVVFDKINTKLLNIDEIVNIYVLDENEDFIKNYSKILIKNKKFNTFRNNLIIKLIIRKYVNIEEITPEFLFDLFEKDLKYPLEEILLNTLLNIILELLNFFDRNFKLLKRNQYKEKNYLLYQLRFALLYEYNKKILSKYQKEISEGIIYMQDLLLIDIFPSKSEIKNINFNPDIYLYDYFWRHTRKLPLINKTLVSKINKLFNYSTTKDNHQPLLQLEKTMAIRSLDDLRIFEGIYLPVICNYTNIDDYNFKVMNPYIHAKKNHYKTIKSLYTHLLNQYDKAHNLILWYNLILFGKLNEKSYMLINPRLVWVNYKENGKNFYGDLRYIYKSKLYHIRVYLNNASFDLSRYKLLELFKELYKKGLFKFQNVKFQKGGKFKNQITLDISKKLKEDKHLLQNSYFKSLEILKVEEI